MELETSVASLKQAEAKATEMAAQAVQHKDAKLADARGQAANVVEKARREASELRDRLLADERKKVERQVDEISSSARKEADGLRKKKVPAAVAKKVAEIAFKGLI